MANKRKKINGSFYVLQDGVSYEKNRNRIAVTSYVDGKRARLYFDATPEGVALANERARSVNEEKKLFGQTFGAISDDEKRAIDIWRAYRDSCMREGCSFKSMSEVMQAAMEKVQAVSISPTLKEAAKLYLDDMIRRNNGELSPHIQTTKNRLQHMIDALGHVRLCNLEEYQITDFLEGLKNPQTGKPAMPRTQKQYLGIFKSISLYAVRRGLLEEKKNQAKGIDAPKVKRTEPDILSVETVGKIFAFVRDNPKYHAFIPALAVGFFCGARLAERCRMRYNDIFPGGRNEVYLSCEITKNDVDRYIYPQANFRAWMDFARAHGVNMERASYLIPGDTENRRKDAHNRLLDRIAAAAGVDLPKNCIRHSAATYMTELQGFTTTANQLGHGEGMLKKHYRRAVTRQEAEAYFNITPENTAPAIGSAPLIAYARHA